MNSRNARSKTQRELSGRAVRKRPALMVTFLTLLGLILGACGTPATDMTAAIGTRCPDAVQQLVDPQVTLEITPVRSWATVRLRVPSSPSRSRCRP